MARYAVVNKETNEVVNVIEWDGVSKWSPPEDHYTMLTQGCAIGDFWDDKRDDFVRPLKNLLPKEDL